MSGAVLRGGPSATGRLAERLAARLGVERDRVLLAGSGTEALTLALESVLLAGREGPVALPGYTCWDVGTAVQALGLEARFYDLDPEDLTPQPDSLRDALSDGAAALVVSPLFGYPVDWTALRRLAEDRGAVLIEDAAQCHGSSWAGRPPGSVGDLAVLSFSRGKGWTGGGGGCLVLNADGLPAPRGPLGPPPRAAFLRWLAGALAQPVLGRPTLYAVPSGLPWLRLGESVYHAPSRPTAMPGYAAALALATEAAAEEEAARRRERALRLLESVPANARVHPLRPAGHGEAGFLRLAILVEAPSPRWTRAARRLGTVRAYPRALPDVEGLRSIVPAAPPPLPGARLLARGLFTIPTHSLLSPSDLERTATLLTRA